MQGEVSLFSSFGQQIATFVVWWLIKVPAAILHFTRERLLDFDEMLQFDVTLRLLLNLEPLFGDYNLSGRVIGVLARTIRLVITMVTYLAVILLGLATLVLWYVLPAISIIFLIG